MALGDDAGSLNQDILAQLLRTRGVAEDEVAKHAKPTMREFLPNPSEFRDMDRAAERIASAIFADEQITIYGDYDVDGATSAARIGSWRTQRSNRRRKVIGLAWTGRRSR